MPSLPARPVVTARLPPRASDIFCPTIRRCSAPLPALNPCHRSADGDHGLSLTCLRQPASRVPPLRGLPSTGLRNAVWWQVDGGRSLMRLYGDTVGGGHRALRVAGCGAASLALKGCLLVWGELVGKAFPWLQSGGFTPPLLHLSHNSQTALHISKNELYMLHIQQKIGYRILLIEPAPQIHLAPPIARRTYRWLYPLTKLQTSSFSTRKS